MPNLPANDPTLRAWVSVLPTSDFPIQNLPFGIFRDNADAPSHPATAPRVGVAIGDDVLDLAGLHALGYFESVDLPPGVFAQPTLNPFIALGQPTWRAVRQCLSYLLRHDNPALRDHPTHRAAALRPQRDVTMQLPIKVGDYTDFYSSREHATNVGSMFRDPTNALLPNWLHLPVAYHGRASSIVVSGTDVRRPHGQSLPAGATVPVFGPTRQLDFELELAFVVGKENALGQPVPTADAEDHLFGVLLFNDWSARDVQAWEYAPLGPFLGKNFASSVSPWVVTLDALAPFRIPAPAQEPTPLPYLQSDGAGNFDINLEVSLRPAGSDADTPVCATNGRHLYWTVAQQLAHHTVGGCNLRVGDVLATGTISGLEAGSQGSLLELTRRGTQPLTLPDGIVRTFLEDGDTVVMRGHAQRNGVRVGFGELRGTVVS